MLATSDLSLNFDSRKLFEDVNIKFVPETAMESLVQMEQGNLPS